MSETTNWTDYLGLLFGLASALGLVTYWHSYRTKRWQDDLRSENPYYPQKLIDRYAQCGAQGYCNSLRLLLVWADGFYGQRLSRKAFSRCLLLAYLYPLLAALLAWVLWNQTNIGGLKLFQDIEGWSGRLWRGLMVVALSIALITYFQNLERISGAIAGFVKKLVFRNSQRSGFLMRADRWLSAAIDFIAFAGTVAVAGAFAGAFAVAGAFALAFAGTVAVAGTGAGTVAGTFAFAATGAGAGTVAVAGTFAFAFALALAGESEISAVYGFFFILLPFTNAVADWLSLAATRWFLTDMLHRAPGAWGILWHLLLDLIVGAACLFILLAGIVGLLELWAMLHAPSLPLDWRAYWAAARVDGRNGFALWLICFTTLLPTLIHVVWALTVWQTQQTTPARRAVAMMQAAATTTPEPAWCNEVAALLWRALIRGFGRGAIFWGPVITVLGWLGLRLWQL